jgi:hypothetical protein
VDAVFHHLQLAREDGLTRGIARKKRLAHTVDFPNLDVHAVSLEILDQWVTWMVTAGKEHDCDFDGWGALV